MYAKYSLDSTIRLKDFIKMTVKQITAESGTIYLPPFNNITKVWTWWTTCSKINTTYLSFNASLVNSSAPVSSELFYEYKDHTNATLDSYTPGIGIIRINNYNKTDLYLYCNGDSTSQCSSLYSENPIPNTLWCLAIANFWNDSLKVHVDISFAPDGGNSTNSTDVKYDSPISRSCRTFDMNVGCMLLVLVMILKLLFI
ncbi:12436_t:CDS:2 [Dentiscutata erythropus]|uniref:12436_t:CDS:1 n=1 Tax=Dentiscutata erythropus TaxID=1348616 RepID=A0A9N8ZIZ5_9GLOM|nr:12436_t:CDS:2 [Dentiscutata erythropus]